MKVRKAILKSNIWGNYYLLVSGRKVREWKGSVHNKPEIIEFVVNNYPEYTFVDKTYY